MVDSPTWNKQWDYRPINNGAPGLLPVTGLHSVYVFGGVRRGINKARTFVVNPRSNPETSAERAKKPGNFHLREFGLHSEPCTVSTNKHIVTLR
jgi:hypothetical protein